MGQKREKKRFTMKATDHPVSRGAVPEGPVCDYVHSGRCAIRNTALGFRQWRRIGWDDAFTRIVSVKTDRDASAIEK